MANVAGSQSAWNLRVRAGQRYFQNRFVVCGLAPAYVGQREAAIRQGQRAIEILPMARDAYSGPYIRHQFVRIYRILGDRDKALDLLEPLLEVPYFLTSAWLSVDPNFAPLRGHPRFERLVRASR